MITRRHRSLARLLMESYERSFRPRRGMDFIQRGTLLKDPGRMAHEYVVPRPFDPSAADTREEPVLRMRSQEPSGEGDCH